MLSSFLCCLPSLIESNHHLPLTPPTSLPPSLLSPLLLLLLFLPLTLEHKHSIKCSTFGASTLEERNLATGDWSGGLSVWYVSLSFVCVCRALSPSLPSTTFVPSYVTTRIYYLSSLNMHLLSNTFNTPISSLPPSLPPLFQGPRPPSFRPHPLPPHRPRKHY
jgi:hypothetical protein